MDDISSFRSQFPITKSYTFLNHAAVSPVSMRVVRAVASLFLEFSHCGIDCYPKWMHRIAEVRRQFARLIHCDPNEVAFTGSTSEGLSAIAAGLEWKEGDIVLVPRPEFPANIYPWMNLERQGVHLQFVERQEGRFGVKEIEKALRPHARLLSVSSVDFAAGFRSDLEALGDFCKKKGLLFCVDAIQSLGVIPMDVRKSGIHFLASGSHKWLLGAMGCGALFISKDVNDMVRPGQVGWKSVEDEEDFFRVHFDLKPDALRFEPGTMNVAGIYALGAALDLLLEVGIERIYERVLAINKRIFKGLKDRNVHITTPMGEGERSGILSFAPSANTPSLFKSLTRKKIMVSLRDGMIRISPHFYNNGDDIRSLLHALDHSDR